MGITLSLNVVVLIGDMYVIGDVAVNREVVVLIGDKL